MGVRCTTYGHIRVPYYNISRIGATHVELQNNSTRSNISNCKPHIMDLGNTNIAGVVDLYDGLWVVGIAESAPDARYHGPSLPDNADS